MTRRLAHFLCLVALVFAGLAPPALALKPIVLDPDQDRIEITALGDLYEGHGDSLQVETAPGADGATDRVNVAAATAGTSPNWMVFALTNPTDNAIERWITADRYTVAGSGAIWPDLDARRIEAVTPHMGFAADRVKSERADVFRITIEPGQTITYVVELASNRFARINLWKPLEYELKVRDRQLFNGIMLGLTALLAIFLTSIFVANHKLIFPASALVAWCVLANLCVDFGFFHKLFQLKAEDNAIYRAAAESALAASLLIFTHTFLRLGTLPALVRMIITVWMVAQLSLIGVAVIDPQLAATFARLSFVVLAVVGSAVILLLALRGQDRAMSLVPPWVMFCVWLFGAAVVLTGRVTGDIASSSLVSGLVLVLLLIGFVVTQFAFRARDVGLSLTPTEMQLRSVALDGAGCAVWEWNARRDAISVSPVVEEILDLVPGQLSTKVEEFVAFLHPADRERFRLMLWTIQERAGGKIRTDLRLRHSDNSFRWFEIEAASIPQEEDRQVRCVGLIRDITDAKRSHERLLHDAVHDSLTGLPNRALLMDRIKTAALRAASDRAIRPTLFFIDIDKFKSVNSSFGLVVGDSLLLTVARRLQRHLTAEDTLARVGGDQFAILSLTDQDAQGLASLAERIRRSLRSPVKLAGQDIVLTGSLGVAVYNGGDEGQQDLLKDAETAMYRAKRGGADRIEIFRPEMRSDREDRLGMEAELRKAIERNQIRFLYQPVYYLPTEELAGFETIVRWEHPKQGLINPAAIVPVDAESDLISKLGSHVLMRAVRDAATWHEELSRPSQPLFVSVNIASRQMFRQVLVQEVRHLVSQNVLPKDALKLEICESIVMENPEQAGEILEQLRSAGAGLLLDNFGSGYSSLPYLGRLPFDAIKLQRDLVRAAGRDGNSDGVVRSVVAMARELDKKVVADGVETEEDAAFLRAAGCEYAQGYFYGDAVPEAEVLPMLRRVRTSERRKKPRGMFRPKSRRKDEAIDDAVPAAAVAAATANGAANGAADQAAAGKRSARPAAAPVGGGLLPDGRPNGAGGGGAQRSARLRPAGSGAPGAAAGGPPPLPAAGAPPPLPNGIPAQASGVGPLRNGASGNGAVPPNNPPPANGVAPPPPGSKPPGNAGLTPPPSGLKVPAEPTPLGSTPFGLPPPNSPGARPGTDRKGSAAPGSPGEPVGAPSPLARSGANGAPPPIPAAAFAPPPMPNAGDGARPSLRTPPGVSGGNGAGPPPMPRAESGFAPPPVRGSGPASDSLSSLPPMPGAGNGAGPAVAGSPPVMPPRPPGGDDVRPPLGGLPPPLGMPRPQSPMVPPPVHPAPPTPPGAFPAGRAAGSSPHSAPQLPPLPPSLNGAPPPIPPGAFAPPPRPPMNAPEHVPPPPPRQPGPPPPDFSKLPPAIAESLARLAGIDPPSRKD